MHLSLNGIDFLNAIILEINKVKKEELNYDKENFIKITTIYSNFVLGACSTLNQESLELCYKKIKFIISKVCAAFIIVLFKL